MKPPSAKKFLTAEWRHLAMLNYEIDPEVLAPFVPAGTELDGWDGKHLVSLVGFRFLQTRVRGLPIPMHRDFEEVNLRFYVRHKAAEGWRRGVVFIKELVPRWAIAFVAQTFYNEPYLALPMAHRIEIAAGAVQSAEYAWEFRGRKNHLKLETRGAAHALQTCSEAEFITEHYWGYTRQRDGGTLEYYVDHPRWQIYEVRSAQLDCEVAGLYGERFAEYLRGQPRSAFLADGSAVTVYEGRRLS